MDSRSIICYPQPSKQKSRDILVAFATGCGARMASSYAFAPDSAAAFYGVFGIEPLWQKVRHSGVPFFYLDNSYFDATRGTHYRVGINALQCNGDEKPDHDRAKRIGLAPQPFRKQGRHVLVVAQSDHFMRHVAGWEGGSASWQETVLTLLRNATDRQIIVRHWNRNKMAAASTLAEDLQDAWAVVSHSSAALNEALLAGVPAFATGKCAASLLAHDDLLDIERPLVPTMDAVESWAATLAARQWTLDELRSGRCWS